MSDQVPGRRSSLLATQEFDRPTERELPAFFAEETRLREERALAPQLSSDRSGVGNFFRDVGPWFVGLFSFLISYGLLLTFGMLALFSLALGFATLPTPGDLIFGAQPTADYSAAYPTMDYSSIFGTTVVTGGSSAGVRATATAGVASTATARVAATQTATAKASAAAAASTDSATLASRLRLAVRMVAFGAAFLALWPGWFGASVAKAHFERTR